MSVPVIKYWNRFYPRTLRSHLLNLFRTTTNEPCEPKSEPRLPKCESCPPKPEPRSPKLEQSPCQTCPEPPPCPPMPQCPPRISASVPDSNNPCNYCPPPCLDPNYPDLTKLKKKQCNFQQNADVPMYLRGGKMDYYLYQLAVILTLVSLIAGIIPLIKLVGKQR